MSYPSGCGFQISWARTREIAKSLHSLGYIPKYRSGRGHGIDCIVDDKQGNLVAIMEITNYNNKNIMSPNKADRTKAILSLYPNLTIPAKNPASKTALLGIRRVLVVSFTRNCSPWTSKFHGTVTDTIVLGFQTLPTDLYNRYPHLFQNPLLKKEGKGTQRMTTVKLKKLFDKYGITP